jgi:hypothetical protein
VNVAAVDTSAFDECLVAMSDTSPLASETGLTKRKSFYEINREQRGENRREIRRRASITANSRADDNTPLSPSNPLANLNEGQMSTVLGVASKFKELRQNRKIQELEARFAKEKKTDGEKLGSPKLEATKVDGTSDQETTTNTTAMPHTERRNSRRGSLTNVRKLSIINDIRKQATIREELKKLKDSIKVDEVARLTIIKKEQEDKIAESRRVILEQVKIEQRLKLREGVSNAVERKRIEDSMAVEEELRKVQEIQLEREQALLSKWYAEVEEILHIEKSNTEGTDGYTQVAQQWNGLRLDKLMKKLVLHCKKTLEAEVCTMFLISEDGEELWSRFASNKHVNIRFPSDAGIAGRCFQSKTLLDIPNAYEHPLFNRDIDRKTGFITRSILCSPIWTSGGRVIGVCQMINKIVGDDADGSEKCIVGPFLATDQSTLQSFCRFVGDMVESKQLQEKEDEAIVKQLNEMRATQAPEAHAQQQRESQENEDKVRNQTRAKQAAEAPAKEPRELQEEKDNYILSNLRMSDISESLRMSDISESSCKFDDIESYNDFTHIPIKKDDNQKQKTSKLRVFLRGVHLTGKNVLGFQTLFRMYIAKLNVMRMKIIIRESKEFVLKTISEGLQKISDALRAQEEKMRYRLLARMPVTEENSLLAALLTHFEEAETKTIYIEIPNSSLPKRAEITHFNGIAAEKDLLKSSEENIMEPQTYTTHADTSNHHDQIKSEVPKEQANMIINLTLPSSLKGDNGDISSITEKSMDIIELTTDWSTKLSQPSRSNGLSEPSQDDLSEPSQDDLIEPSQSSPLNKRSSCEKTTPSTPNESSTCPPLQTRKEVHRTLSKDSKLSLLTVAHSDSKSTQNLLSKDSKPSLRYLEQRRSRPRRKSLLELQEINGAKQRKNSTYMKKGSRTRAPVPATSAAGASWTSPRLRKKQLHIKMETHATKIQCAWRCNRSRGKRADMEERRRMKEQLQKITSASTKIQQRWRKFLQVRMLHKIEKMQSELRERNNSATAETDRSMTRRIPSLKEEVSFSEWFKIPSLKPVRFGEVVLRIESPSSYKYDDVDVDISVNDIITRVNSATPQFLSSSRSQRSPIPPSMPDRPKSVNHFHGRRQIKIIRPQSSFEVLEKDRGGYFGSTNYDNDLSVHDWEGQNNDIVSPPSLLNGDSFSDFPDPYMLNPVNKREFVSKSGLQSELHSEDMLNLEKERVDLTAVKRNDDYNERISTAQLEIAEVKAVAIFDTVRFYGLFFAKNVRKLGFGSWMTGDIDELEEYLKAQRTSMLFVNADLPDELYVEVIKRVRDAAMPQWNIPIISYCNGIEEVAPSSHVPTPSPLKLQ